MHNYRVQGNIIAVHDDWEDGIRFSLKVALSAGPLTCTAIPSLVEETSFRYDW
jgi:hypothetical protein